MKTEKHKEAERRLRNRLVSLTMLGLALGTGTVLATPTNDSFGNTTLLEGENGNLTSINRIDATFETNEPECVYAESTNTAWFKWICVGAKNFMISTMGFTHAGAFDWDAVMCVYTGSTLDNLPLVKPSDKDVEKRLALLIIIK